MIVRSASAALGASFLCLLTLSCERAEPEAEYVEKPDWTPHEKRLLDFIERYKTDDAQQARAAMAEELDYLSEPLEEELSDANLAYLRAMARIRLAMIIHHLGDERGAQALFDLGTMEFNQWAEGHDKGPHEQAEVIEAVIGFDQDFEAAWHEPWRSQLGMDEPTG